MSTRGSGEDGEIQEECREEGSQGGGGWKAEGKEEGEEVLVREVSLGDSIWRASADRGEGCQGERRVGQEAPHHQ